MSDDTGAIREDATTQNSALSEEQAMQALLDRWDEDAEQPSQPEAPKERGSDEDDFASDEHESTDATDEHDEVSEDAESTTDEAKPVARVASDEDEVEVKVGEETLKLSVKDLKRVFGQEYAVNKKSMEVAELRKAAESKIAFADHKINRGIERAEQRWKEYENLDPTLLAADLASGRITEEQYLAIKGEAEDRYNELQTARKERTEFQQAVNAERERAEHQRLHAAAKQIREAFPDWLEIAPKIEAYADQLGLSKQEQMQHLDVRIITALNKARLYDEAQSRKPEIKRVVAEPTKVLKPQSVTHNQRDKSADEAMRNLRKSGSMDDAVAALLARRGN